MKTLLACTVSALVLSTAMGCSVQQGEALASNTSEQRARKGGGGGGGGGGTAEAMIEVVTDDYFQAYIAEDGSVAEGMVHGVGTIPATACQYHDPISRRAVTMAACGPDEYCNLSEAGNVVYPNDPATHGSHNGPIYYGRCVPTPAACEGQLDGSNTRLFCVNASRPGYMERGHVTESPTSGECICENDVIGGFIVD